MSGDIGALALLPDDVTKILASASHIGATQCTKSMVPYVYKCRTDNVHILKIDRMWEKLLLAARAVAAVEHPQDIFAVSTRQYGHRAVLKFAAHTGCTPIAGRFTPGTFTNQRQKGFREPRLLIVSDPLTDHQAIFESAYANVPVVAFSNTDARLKFVDIAVPWNTKSQYAIGVMWWLLTREVLRLRGQLLRTTVWTIVPDLYFYRDPEDEAEEAALEAAVAKADRSVSDVEKLLAAVDLDEAKRGDEATVSNAIETEMVGGDEWPDQFRVADWNEAVQVDDEASKAQTTSAATWGADGKLF